MRFHAHVIVGYSMHKIQAATIIFCICCTAFTFAAWLLHLLHGFCICCMAFTFTAQFLHAWLYTLPCVFLMWVWVTLLGHHTIFALMNIHQRNFQCSVRQSLATTQRKPPKERYSTNLNIINNSDEVEELTCNVSVSTEPDWNAEFSELKKKLTLLKRRKWFYRISRRNS